MCIPERVDECSRADTYGVYRGDQQTCSECISDYADSFTTLQVADTC